MLNCSQFSSYCITISPRRFSKPDCNRTCSLTLWERCSSDSSHTHSCARFSYPLESPGCSDDSSSFDTINADRLFRAHEESVWRDNGSHLRSRVQKSNDLGESPASRDSEQHVRTISFSSESEERISFTKFIHTHTRAQFGRAVLPQIWWGFGDQNLWQQTKAAILSLLQDSQLGPVAPYVFHSLAFGSEPIGDGVDGDNFVGDLQAMKDALQPYGIPITISEDWDRPGIMSTDDDSGLGPVGQQIAPVLDLLHVHGERTSKHVATVTTTTCQRPRGYSHVQQLCRTTTRTVSPPRIISGHTLRNTFHS